MGHYVYKYVNGDEIVYIGKNDTRLKTRIDQHKKEEKFSKFKDADIYYIELANKAETKAVETFLINKYKPILNVADKYPNVSSFLVFDEPKWTKYENGAKLKKKDPNTENENIEERFMVHGLASRYSFRELYEFNDQIVNRICKISPCSWFRINDRNCNERISFAFDVRIDGNCCTEGDKDYILISNKDGNSEWVELSETSMKKLEDRYKKCDFVSDLFYKKAIALTDIYEERSYTSKSHNKKCIPKESVVDVISEDCESFLYGRVSKIAFNGEEYYVKPDSIMCIEE